MIKGKAATFYERILRMIEQRERDRPEHNNKDVKYGFELALLYVTFARHQKKNAEQMLKNRLEKWDDIYKA